MKSLRQHSDRQAGFTLLEVVTAIALFSAVMVITVGAFTRFVDVQRRDIDEQAFQEDIRLAVGLFNREARGAFGDTYEGIIQVGEDGMLGTEDDEPSIFFHNQNTTCVRYFISDGQFVRNESATGGRTADCSLPDNYDSADDRALTGDDSTIINMQFRIQQSRVDCENFFDPDAPGTPVPTVVRRGYITVLIAAEAAAKEVPLQLQSTVTSRQTVSINNDFTCP